ncbi:response regulator [Virgibacillus sp. 179-BFC.A HS]|uniref:Response regulator n=1 Tax=Tigheibacillus jepli TaxID=3035914 RepID=A0ABU5CE91_9BACI|nr:response regulator [Virgibacillus sp. 179-BFC.A HS]MDY0404540.1 response regulator [Virgibacillus sp. 179-BFC.A HS]
MLKEILIVDDEPGIRMLLEEIFKSAGYHVQSAETGNKALDKLLQFPIDLLVIDYKLPIMDGIEVLKALEKEKMTVPAILMTGMVESISEEIGPLDNVKHVLSKPFNIVDVLEITEKILK